MLVCPGCRTVYEEQLEVCPKDNLPLIVRSTGTVDTTEQRETTISPGMMVGE